MRELICAHPACGRPFTVKRMDKRRRFCSVSCGRWRPRNGKVIQCCECGKDFERRPRSQQKYCSVDCAHATRPQFKPIVVDLVKRIRHCAWERCANFFTVRKGTGVTSRRYCSQECSRARLRKSWRTHQQGKRQKCPNKLRKERWPRTPEQRERHQLMAYARDEARERGCSVGEVMREWRLPVKIWRHEVTQ
jgi:hypothetical protein